MTTPRGQRDHDLAILAAGGDTGWWDEHGQPAPFPDDFFDPDNGWRQTPTTPTPPPPNRPSNPQNEGSRIHHSKGLDRRPSAGSSRFSPC
jgi:hypothetical protein